MCGVQSLTTYRHCSASKGSVNTLWLHVKTADDGQGGKKKGQTLLVMIASFVEESVCRVWLLVHLRWKRDKFCILLLALCTACAVIVIHIGGSHYSVYTSVKLLLKTLRFTSMTLRCHTGEVKCYCTTPSKKITWVWSLPATLRNELWRLGHSPGCPQTPSQDSSQDYVVCEMCYMYVPRAVQYIILLPIVVLREAYHS